MVKQRLLIVDDNPMIAKMVALWLEKTGRYQTSSESRPLRALEAARRFKPDLVLLDVDMPDMDGSEVAEAIRHDHDLADTPILFLTAQPAKREAALRHRDGIKFIKKPVSPAWLVEHVAEALEEHREAAAGQGILVKTASAA